MAGRNAPRSPRRAPLRAALVTGALALSGTGLALLSGCGPDCQSTCNRLYNESECNIQSPGATREELLGRCNTECGNALDVPGEVGDYNPNEYTPSNENIELENDKRAAVWMDCVAATSCEFLNDGYCAPVW